MSPLRLVLTQQNPFVSDRIISVVVGVRLNHFDASASIHFYFLLILLIFFWQNLLAKLENFFFFSVYFTYHTPF